MDFITKNLKKIWNDRYFWISLGIAIPLSIVHMMGYYYPELFYLQIPMAAMIMGTLPAIAATVLSVKFALIYVSCHKFYENFRNRGMITYTILKDYSKKGSALSFSTYNIWYTVGITFLILRFSGINFDNEEQLLTLTMSFIFLGVIFGTGINFTVFLIQKTSIFFENKKDGSRINLGNDLRRKIDYGFAPVQIVLVIYTIFSETNWIPFFVTLGFTLFLCFIASLTSYLLLKRHYIEKLYVRFNEKLVL